MAQEWQTQIDGYVAAHEGDLLALARDLIAHPTVSPPGRNTAAAQRFVADYLAGLGAAVDLFEVYPGDPDVVGTLRGAGGGRSLLFNGHVDVAEVGLEADWRHPPFAPVVENGRLYGRGAADMKGGLAAALFAARCLRDLGLPLAGDVVFEVVVGEESGEAGTVACVERGYRADFAVVPEPTGLTISGQGGVVTAWITIQSPETLHDGIRRRIIHAGGGLFGASAIEKMVKVIQGLQELERHWAVTKSYPGFPPGATTINPAVVEGGRHPAFLADRCALWCTFHFYPDETAEGVAAEVEEHVRRVAEADVWLRQHPPTFRWGGSSMIVDRGEVFPAVPLDREGPGVQCLAAAHESVLGDLPDYQMWPSVSDAGWLARAGIPAVVYGPGELEQAHTLDESVAVADLLAAARVYARLMYDWCSSH